MKKNKKSKKRSPKKTLEEKFLASWLSQFPHLPKPEQQARFHLTRKWLLDFFWPSRGLGVEIQGGSFIGGRHNNAYGQAKDYEKFNAATRMGLRILLYNTVQMRDVDAVTQEVAEILTGAE